MFDADLHAVFREDDVVRGEAVLGVLADLVRADVDLVTHEGDAGDDEEEDEEGDELAVFVFCVVILARSGLILSTSSAGCILSVSG